MTGDQLRRLLGTAVVRSLKFEVRRTEDAVELEGSGWGHGVGLCQFGANGMAKQGIPFDQILTHYYTGIDLAPAPPVDQARARMVERRLAERRSRGGG